MTRDKDWARSDRKSERVLILSFANSYQLQTLILFCLLRLTLFSLINPHVCLLEIGDDNELQ